MKNFLVSAVGLFSATLAQHNTTSPSGDPLKPAKDDDAWGNLGHKVRLGLILGCTAIGLGFSACILIICCNHKKAREAEKKQTLLEQAPKM